MPLSDYTDGSERASQRASGVFEGVSSSNDQPLRRESRAEVNNNDYGDVNQEIGDEESTIMALSSLGETFTDASSDASGVHRRKRPSGKCNSFVVSVAVLMMVPIGFLVALAAIRLDEATRSKNYLEEHRPLLLQSLECQDHITNHERLYTSALLGLKHNGVATPLDIAAFEAVVAEQRAASDLHCQLTSEVCRTSKDPAVRAYSVRLSQKLIEFSSVRTKVDYDKITGLEWIDYTANISAAVAELETLFSVREKAFTRALMPLKYIRRYTEVWGAATSLCAEIIALKPQPPTAQMLDELMRLIGSMETHEEYFRQYAPQFVADFDFWLQSSNSLFQNMEWIRSGQVTRYQHLTVDEWHDMTLIGLDDILMPKVLYSALTFKDIDEEVKQATVLMVAGVVASMLAAAVIIYQQHRSSRETQCEREANMRMQRSVSRFVPRQFLRMMGYNSILNIETGAQTEVATTMLFSDINNFTSISESMSNAELFDWLQHYIARMTTITEGHGGFMDKFVGDALFCVFNSSKNAVQCGIAFQVSCEQRNCEMIGEGKEHMLKVGVGIHHAVVAAGILGDAKRRSCTMISSQVNLASRLEGLTRQYGAQILVSKQAFDLVSKEVAEAIEHRFLGRVQVKGMEQGYCEVVEVFQTDDLVMKDYKRITKPVFEAGVFAQIAGNPAAARAEFDKAAIMEARLGVLDLALRLKLGNLGSPVDCFEVK